jgi:arylsulfatase A-like enzyme
VAPLNRVVVAFALGSLVACAGVGSPRLEEKPNIILIFADDLGYGDIGCYGNKVIRTPNIDRMATEGMRFTDFYAQTVCGPSRAALMTGCYPLRVAKSRNIVEVHPRLHLQEVTIAEILKDAGYKTGCFGKWDLARHHQTKYDPALLPTAQGFDYFFGTPTSNDSVVHLLRNEKVIERKASMATLTQRYSSEAIQFIQRNKDHPFFVYIPHTMPHTRLAASKEFRGKSPRGLYGDVIEEIDFHVGRILDTVKRLGLDRKTYVIFTSDNGPWWIKKQNGGSAGPLRGAKTSVWEGGVRVPFVVRAPGRVPAGSVCREMASTMDMLPTFARLGGSKVPTNRVIDGHDVADLVHGVIGGKSPTKALFHYVHTHLQAVRSGKWKLHVPRPANPRWTPNWARHIDARDVFDIASPLLYDLDADVGETTDVAATHPDVVRRLLGFVEGGRADIGDYDRIGAGARFFDDDPRRPDIGK